MKASGKLTSVKLMETYVVCPRRCRGGCNAFRGTRWPNLSQLDRSCAVELQGSVQREWQRSIGPHALGLFAADCKSGCLSWVAFNCSARPTRRSVQSRRALILGPLVAALWGARRPSDEVGLH